MNLGQTYKGFRSLFLCLLVLNLIKGSRMIDTETRLWNPLYLAQLLVLWQMSNVEQKYTVVGFKDRWLSVSSIIRRVWHFHALDNNHHCIAAFRLVVTSCMDKRCSDSTQFQSIVGTSPSPIEGCSHRKNTSHQAVAKMQDTTRP